MCTIGKVITSHNLSPDQALIGFRSWKAYGAFLEPVYNPMGIYTTWHPKEIYTSNKLPLSYNESGFWFFKDEDSMLALDQTLWYQAVHGACYLWGSIIEHEFGYRAEFAKIIYLAIGGLYLHRSLKRLDARYEQFGTLVIKD